MFDLAKIALALDAAEKIGTNPTVQMLLADARDEFVKLREAIESALVRDVVEGRAGPDGYHEIHVPSGWRGRTVLLVKVDE